MTRSERERERRSLLKEFAEVEGGAGLIAFGRAVNQKAAQYRTPDFHYDLADLACAPPGQVQRAVIEAPRGFAKTTLLGVWWPLWHAFVRPYAHGLISWEEYVRGQRPPAFFVLVSKTRPHSINLITSIKDIIEGPVFRWLFGDHGQAATQAAGGMWTKDEVHLPKGDIFLARGTGQPVRGLNVKGRRLSGFVFDDPEDENNTKTDEALQANLDWLQKGLGPAVARPDLGGDKQIVIGTPISATCMVRKLRTFPGWEARHYGAVVHHPDGSRESLWPEMWPLADLERERSVYEEQNRLSVFASEYLCEIVADEERLFKRWGYWRGDLEVDRRGQHYLRLRARSEPTESEKDRREGLRDEPERVIAVNVFMGIDPASSVRKTADRTAVVAVAVDDDDNRYVLPYFADRVPPSVVVERCLSSYERYRPIKTTVETTGYQEMLGGALRGKVQGLVGEKPRGSKSERLEQMEPLFAAGKVYLQPEMGILENELMQYPNASHDDVMDALYYAMRKTYPPMHSAEHRAEGRDHRKKRRDTSWMAA